jgi:ATP-dependent RNA/DNA helicase IGHMBP2
MPQTIDTHFDRLLRLMELEAEAEKQQALQAMARRTPAEAEASGYSLINLVIREEEAGLGGRILLTLSKRTQGQALPWTRLGVGAPVILSEEGAADPLEAAARGWRGVISQIGRDSVQAAFSDWPEPSEDAHTFRLDRSNDEIARQRQRKALERARSLTAGRQADLRDILLGLQAPVFHSHEGVPSASESPLDGSLNASQWEAVRFALSAQDIALLHGPPGTGKTTTVVELIRQAVRQGSTVLACAPSNLAVDNLLERLLAHKENALRLGHPARVLPELRAHTLDLMVENHPEMRVARKLTRDAYKLFGQASRYTRARPEPGARQAMRAEARQMLAEARRLEDQIVHHLIDSAQIICATNTGLDSHLLGRRVYDWVIMDEASQSTEPEAWIAVLRGRRLVLAGDPCQLPPTVVSQHAAAEGFRLSLMERLMDQPEFPPLDRLLTVQYRMHQDIMAFSAREFYDDQLTAAPAVRDHLLAEIPGIISTELTSKPVQFIDTAGASYDESQEPDGESRLNPQEAELAARKVEALLETGLPAASIAVITPYAAQARWLRERLKHPDLEVDTVDGFQGREKEAVVVTLVRSNPLGEIGFLADVRRMNVALTRARRKLIVIGDSATISEHSFYRRLVAYFEAIGAYHSVWEEMEF